MNFMNFWFVSHYLLKEKTPMKEKLIQGTLLQVVDAYSIRVKADDLNCAMTYLVYKGDEFKQSFRSKDEARDFIASDSAQNS
jgi:hypothetical protein